MPTTTSTIITFLSVLTIIGNALILLLLGLLIYQKTASKISVRLMQFIGRWGLAAAFITAAMAMAGSLYFSEIALFAPCKLCWLQRICMYPLVVIFGLAILKKHRHVSIYGITLAAIGSLLAAYHYYLQVFAPSSEVCSVNDLVPCSEKVSLHFGYITFPMMSLTAFILIILFLSFHSWRDKVNGLDV